MMYNIFLKDARKDANKDEDAGMLNRLYVFHIAHCKTAITYQ